MAPERRPLLDSHVSARVAVALREHGHDAVTLVEWHNGRLLDASDEEIAEAAHADERVLVTFDVNTIPALLSDLADAGTAHAGVVFISRWTMAPNDIGAIVRALERFLKERAGEDFVNCTEFLSRA